MTQASTTRTGTTTVIESLDPHDLRMIDLGTALIEAAMDDATVLDGIPSGATLVLLPVDDPAYVDQAIAVGLEAVHRGRDVYFRHLRLPSASGPAAGDVSRS
jgi:hypothetical protein